MESLAVALMLILAPIGALLFFHGASLTSSPQQRLEKIQPHV